VVPRAEKKIGGGGVMVERLEGQALLSLEIIGWSFGEAEEGSRRARVWMLEIGERERRVLRMWEPCLC